MSEIRSGSEAGAAAALVGSLATFSLVDVLDLLGRTGQTGELQLVGRDIDWRVWVDRGYLIGGPASDGLGALLFHLACSDEGWFYFNRTDRVPEGGERIALTFMLGDLGSQVEDWRRLVSFLPFEATVCMASSTPGPEVQIRADQWQLLSVVGTSGRTVNQVVESAPSTPLETLRTLYELTQSGLVAVGATPGRVPEEIAVEPEPRPVPPEPEPEPATDHVNGNGSHQPPNFGAPAWSISDLSPGEVASPQVTYPPQRPIVAPSGGVPPAPDGWVANPGERRRVRRGVRRHRCLDRAGTGHGGAPAADAATHLGRSVVIDHHRVRRPRLTPPTH